MVGDGELQQELAARVRASGPARCALPGVIRDMPAAYAALDLIVLTSRSEGTPVVLLEGMAAGKAFVATRVGGIRDLMVGRPRTVAAGVEVYDNGVLADENADAIAAGVSFLLERPDDRRRMGEAGRAFVTGHFSASRLADDLEALYRRLLTNKANRRVSS
jgi:glycosyltransferase involved in cell wall biosynthesis